MYKKTCTRNRFKCLMLFLSFVFFLFIIFYFGNFSILGVNANPDYICVKNITDSPCIISSCGAWNTDGTRTCIGRKTTQVSYYLRRTTCEAGYTRVSRGSDSGGSSGRQSSDFVSGSNSCTVIEVDNVAPTGEVK